MEPHTDCCSQVSCEGPPAQNSSLNSSLNHNPALNSQIPGQTLLMHAGSICQIQTIFYNASTSSALLPLPTHLTGTGSVTSQVVEKNPDFLPEQTQKNPDYRHHCTHIQYR